MRRRHDRGRDHLPGREPPATPSSLGTCRRCGLWMRCREKSASSVQTHVEESTTMVLHAHDSIRATTTRSRQEQGGPGHPAPRVDVVVSTTSDRR